MPPNGSIAGLSKIDFQDVFYFEAMFPQPMRHCSRQLRVEKKAHRSGVRENRIIYLLSREFQARTNVFGLKEGIVLEDFRF